MKKTSLLLLLVLSLLLAVGLTACAPAEEEAAPVEEEAAPVEEEEAAPAEEEEAPAEEEAAPVEEEAVAECPVEGGVLKIGALWPVSGAAATQAQKIIAGASMAVEERNAEGGVLGCEVELIVEDTQADAAVALSAAEKLLNQDQVQGIVGAYHSHATLAVQPILPDYEVPMLTVIATSPVITEENNGWVFRISSSNAYDAQSAISQCWDDVGFNSWAFMPVNNDWGKSVPLAYEEVIGEMDGETALVEPLEQGSANFLPQLTKLRASDADTVAATIDIESLTTLAKQAYEAGMTGEYNWVATSGTNPGDFMPILADTEPGAMEGWYFVSYYKSIDLPGGDFPLNVEFMERFTERWPDIPGDYPAVNGYQGVDIMMNAIERAGVYDGASIRESLFDTDYEGMTGHLTFDEKGQATLDVHLQQILNGERIIVDCE